MHKHLMRAFAGIACLWFGAFGAEAAGDAAIPKTIAYSAAPTAYFDEHASEVATIYDGFFFVLGDWDEGVRANVGLGPDSPAATDWMARAGKNLEHLRAAGVTENLLSVCFSETGAWPSPETLLSADHAAKLARHFGRLGEVARELGFRGVSIDVEYPYRRYSLDNPVYKYDGYTAEDLTAAADRQGRAVMGAVLYAFPEAVVWVLPGVLGDRPIERAFASAMLDVMAERDAPGGLHLGSERSYGLLDAVAQVAIPRSGDLAARALFQGKTLDYWKRRCTVAPGVWPLHMVETGSPDYPVRAWRDELAELRQQMQILRTVSKRYIWSFSGQPVWYPYSAELAQRYGLPKQDFDGAAEAIAGWHEVLRERKRSEDAGILKLARVVRQFDRGRLSAAELCSRFGTPGDWLILGPLGNPFTHPAFSAPSLGVSPLCLDAAVDGRDGLVRWFRYRNFNALGQVNLPAAFGWRGMDDCSALLATTVIARSARDGYLWIGWDDGVVVRFDGQTVFSHPQYPERGHGMVFKDRYDFEEHVPLKIPKGEHLLTVTSINAKGRWGVNLRIGDENGFPLDGVSFSVCSTI
ncbi:MAG: hypothetical protein HZB26_07875 [Candidatus Hydrogenedentes bacterium]|nr:hypothetical protein [Candidatus Hydrogenedentota bacterium]